MNLKQSTNAAAKNMVARYAARLIKDYQMIYIDDGSATLEMIDYIVSKNITVVTIGNYLDKKSERCIEVAKTDCIDSYVEKATVDPLAAWDSQMRWGVNNPYMSTSTSTWTN